MPAFCGGCACGAIRYECSAEPLFAARCHCRDCQRELGAGFVPVLGVPADAFRVTRGAPRGFTVTADSGHPTTRFFCADCGSPLFGRPGVAPEMVTIRAGSLDDPAAFRPARNLYVSRAQPWATMDPALPKLPRLPHSQEPRVPRTFSRETTTNELLEGVSLSGRRVLITGGSAGLGAETARALAAAGAHVVVTARDAAKGERAAAAARAGAAPGARVEVAELDLESLASVRACADRLLGEGRPLHALIANAGVMAAPQGRTRDGFETQFGTNHLGHFVLVNRLVPLLVRGAPARVVVLSSSGHRFADVDLEDPGFTRTPYDPWLAYGRSKTANVLFAVALDRRLAPRGVRACAVHPGGIRTELSRHLTEQTLQELVSRMARGGVKMKSVEQGAATSVWAAFIADAAEIGGRYCEDCSVAKLTQDAQTSAGVRAYALDPARAEALWRRSEEWVGERFPA